MSPLLPTVTQDGIKDLEALLQQRVTQAETPAIFWLATNAKEEIYSNQGGLRIAGVDQSGQVDADTTLELFSQTKLITSIAALQLVDRGLISLDSEGDIEKFLPELRKLEILTGYGESDAPEFTKPKGKITLRMLMSHSSGCIYNFSPFQPSGLVKYFEQAPTIGHLDPKVTVNDTCWPWHSNLEPRSYMALDWTLLGSQRLHAYFQQHIFDLLGLTTLGFFPTDFIKENKMELSFRLPDGQLGNFPDGSMPTRGQTVDTVSTEFLSGGAGLFGTLREYLVILRAILQSDPSSPHHSDIPIISPQSFKELFSGCIGMEVGRKALAELLPLEGSFDSSTGPSDVDHSVGLLLSLKDSPRGRKKGGGSWFGLAHSHFWIDPASGIAGISGTQLIAFPPDIWFGVYAEFEKTLYANLE